MIHITSVKLRPGQMGTPLKIERSDVPEDFTTGLCSWRLFYIFRSWLSQKPRQPDPGCESVRAQNTRTGSAPKYSCWRRWGIEVAWWPCRPAAKHCPRETSWMRIAAGKCSCEVPLAALGVPWASDPCGVDAQSSDYIGTYEDSSCPSRPRDCWCTEHHPKRLPICYRNRDLAVAQLWVCLNIGHPNIPPKMAAIGCWRWNLWWSSEVLFRKS